MDVQWSKYVSRNLTGRYQDNRITKTANTAWNAGVQSAQSINAGDWYVTTTIVETNKLRAFGVQAYAAAGVQDYFAMPLCLVFQADGNYRVYKSNVSVFGPTAYAAADVFRIDGFDGDQWEVSRNGVVVYSDVFAQTFPMRVSAAFNTGIDNTIHAATVSGDDISSGIYVAERAAFEYKRHNLPPLFGGVNVAPLGTQTGQGYPRGGNRQVS